MVLLGMAIHLVHHPEFQATSVGPIIDGGAVIPPIVPTPFWLWMALWWFSYRTYRACSRQAFSVLDPFSIPRVWFLRLLKFLSSRVPFYPQNKKAPRGDRWEVSNSGHLEGHGDVLPSD